MASPTVNLNYAAEESITDYLIATVDSTQASASFYTGIGNVEDLAAPAVFVQVDSGVEVYPYSNVYDLLVNINVKEMAADVNTNPAGGLGILSATIFNAIANPNIKSAINLNNQRNFSSLFIQKGDMKHTTNGDAMITDMTLRVIGCLSGSISGSPLPSS